VTGFTLNISPAVKQELAEAYRWYADQNIEAAAAFIPSRISPNQYLEYAGNVYHWQ